MRRKSRKVMVGNVSIGGDAAVSVQSMTNTDTRDVKATLAQINALEAAGCQIVRLSVSDAACAEALAQIRKHTKIPLVADIHFDYRLALKSIVAGVDKLRINPGNIGSMRRTEEVAKAAKERGIPVRIGVNGGSMERDLLEKYGGGDRAGHGGKRPGPCSDTGRMRFYRYHHRRQAQQRSNHRGSIPASGG